MAQDAKELVNEFREGRIDRREFMRRAVLLTGSLAAASGLIDSLLPSPARGAITEPNDPALLSEEIQYTGKAGTVYGYLSRPKGAGPYPAIIVIHAIRGVDAHIQDITRRFAKEGYVALAPDYFSRHGGTKKVSSKDGRVKDYRKLAPLDNVVEDTESGFTYLRSLSSVRDDRLGVTGFCWGGGMAFASATRIRGLKAAVIFYGSTPKPIDLVQNIEAPVMAHYGGADEEINQGIDATVAAMKKYNKAFDYKIYPGAKHDFMSDNSKEDYHPEAAKAAWQRTLEFFAKPLKG
ncbi:MAG TPA: dienelactone hydrolase family protein [Candidatus Binatia bacterium]